MQDKAKGAQIRARAEWVEKGERSTSYFLRLENIRQNSAHITTLKDERGDIVKNDKEILSTASDFYRKLYTTRRRKLANIKRYVNKTNVKNKLEEAKMKICEGLVTIEEANDVIKDLRLKKSPGLDGLTAEFYKEFWPDFGHLLFLFLTKLS